MSLDRFLWLLLNQQLWMTRLDLLNERDKFEGIPPPTILHSVMTSADLSAYGIDETADRREALRRIRQQIFVSCWHLSPHESDVMWRSYCPAGGVAIRTTYRRLVASAGGLPVGLVQYVDFSKYRGAYDPILGTWLKRQLFAADQELRIGVFEGWVPQQRAHDPSRMTLSLPISWPYEQTVERVIVYPGADYSYIEAVTDLVNRIVPGLSQPSVAYSQLSFHSGIA